MDVKAHLKRLSQSHGPSGYEKPVRELLQKEWRGLIDTFEVGALGSLVGIKYGTGSEPRRRIMLCPHMDEIGLIVHNIEDGFLRVSRLGSPDAPTLPGQPVLVLTDPPLRGVVGLPPLNTLSDEQRGRYATLQELVIDVGLPTEEVQKRVRVGTPIAFDISPIELQNGRLSGKALDNRACIASLTVCLEALKSRRHEWDVFAVASVQEEVGGWGAMNEAYRLRPDVAVILDVTFGTQPGVSEGDFPLGGGATIGLGANFHPALYEALLEAAKRIEATLAPDPLPMSSGTDAGLVQISREGIPAGLLEVPLRNMHTPVETIDLRDVERAGRILAEFVAGLDADFLPTIVWDKETLSKESAT